MRHHRGWVYDLEVAEHHNYLANGILSSNSTAATYVAVLEALGGMRDGGAGPLVVGYTATRSAATGSASARSGSRSPTPAPSCR